ncbi:MAG: hypothetical protein IT359_07595 [Gemmatimonadaceae bacterium]|nr:hypothetical protein [Gemmatimonadaceae bacterium]
MSPDALRHTAHVARRTRLARSLAAAALTLGALAATACGTSEGGNATGSNGPDTPKTGALTVTVAGVPAGSSAAIQLTGSAGYARTISATETVSALAPGAYELSASDVTAGADRYGATPRTQGVTITAGASASATVGYGILTGSLAITASGLPTGSTTNVQVTGPDSFARTVTAGTTLGGLAPGAYRVTAASVTVESHTYTPQAATLDVAVAASTTPVPVAVAYQIASGALIVGVTGLPGGATAQAVVTGPGGFQKTVASGELLSNLVPGPYLITAAPVTVGIDGYRVSAPVSVAIVASTTPVSVPVAYALATGRLALAVGGLPAGAAAAVTVTGPGGFSTGITATDTLVALAPGDYTIAATPVATATLTYGPTPATQVIAVTAGTTPVAGSVDYAVTTGSLLVTITGLPQALAASVTVTGPANYSQQVANTSTLSNLAPGTYTLTAANATTGSHTYAPSPASRSVTVVAGPSPATAVFAYALSTGGIQFAVNGLAGNVPADITITGPGGYSRNVTASQLLLGLTAGMYTITARNVASGANAWAPNPASQNVAVPASTFTVDAAVTYVTAIGALTVTVNGLPGGVNAAVTVTGAGGYSRAVTATTTITGLAQGIYTVKASSVSNAGTTYTPTPATGNVSVGGGVTSTATVSYSASAPPPPSSLNLVIDGMHVQQVVQTYGGTVPLVAGRDGLLRVFVKANMANTATPTVRVRLYSGATLASTVSIPAPGTSVPQTITEGTLASSWNTTIPAALMQNGLKILADVDPTNTVTESSDSDNSYPVSGTAGSMDVRNVSTLSVRLVPVLQSANGLQGNVTAGNATQFTADILKLYPLTQVDAEVRAPYTTAAPALQSGDNNGAWLQILSEVNALRTADASSRYYYGVVKTSYGSGIAGLGYVPGRAAIGWDHLPSGANVMAHEVGHNLGRFHAPGCGAGGPDPSYPKATGRLEGYGYNIATNALKDTAVTYDLMSYCSPVWISAYTYSAILSYRAANPFVAAASAVAGSYSQRGLLVWGRIQNGQVILEPTYEVDAPPSLPTKGGRNRLQGFGPLGQPLFDFTFDGDQVADHPAGSAEHFAFIVPMGMMGGTSPTRVRASAGARQAEYLSIASTPASAAAPVVQRLNSRAVRLRWNGAEARGVLVRHPRTGEILAFARGGDAVVYTAEGSLDLTLSDGVRSARQRVTVGAPGATPQR